MATYKQYYEAGKRRAAKKMTREQKQKLNAARRQIYKQDALPHNFSLCRQCAYYLQGACSFDGTANPAKSECKNFVRKPRQYK